MSMLNERSRFSRESEDPGDRALPLESSMGPRSPAAKRLFSRRSVSTIKTLCGNSEAFRCN
jgi:hypothetical protein